jgi:histidinol-phosphate phosphatase family protein
VLNSEPGLHGALKPDDVQLIPGAAAAVRRTREAGMLVVAITNRAQVAKGFITFEGLDHILGRLETLLAAEGGVLDRIYFCPHHPEVGFAGEIPELKVRCECRKPGTLLLRRAFADLPIDQNRSMLIGDSLRDIGAARNAGIWVYGVRTGSGCRDTERYRREIGSWPPAPDLMFESVAEAVDFGIGYRALATPVIDALAPLLQERSRPLLVAVCGRSRAGKSTVAHAITRTLSEDANSTLHVRLDDWIVPVAKRVRQATGELRNRVGELPTIVTALRAGKPISAPGYDPASRGSTPATTYNPAGRSVIVLDGSFAAHPSIREMIDLTVFVDVPTALQQSRFAAFYRWKGIDSGATETLWEQRLHDEWPAVDTQRETADLVICSSTNAV